MPRKIVPAKPLADILSTVKGKRAHCNRPQRSKKEKSQQTIAEVKSHAEKVAKAAGRLAKQDIKKQSKNTDTPLAEAQKTIRSNKISAKRSKVNQRDLRRKMSSMAPGAEVLSADEIPESVKTGEIVNLGDESIRGPEEDPYVFIALPKDLVLSVPAPIGEEILARCANRKQFLELIILELSKTLARHDEILGKAFILGVDPSAALDRRTKVLAMLTTIQTAYAEEVAKDVAQEEVAAVGLKTTEQIVEMVLAELVDVAHELLNPQVLALLMGRLERKLIDTAKLQKREEASKQAEVN